MRKNRLGIRFLFAASITVLPGPQPSWPPPPSIQSLLKPSVYDKALNSREVMTHAKIDGERYSFYAAMLVHSNTNDTRAVLTNYALYSKLISYVKKTEYNPANHILEIVGSFMGWTMHSWIRFEERGERWIHYTYIMGHFTGMSGDMYFEPVIGRNGDKSSLVYMGGALSQAKWPPIPKLILEWGAEIVFGFTGNHMRSYIESPDSKTHSTSPSNSNDQQNLPQPRSHL